ncbi:hypothetical protein QQ045_024057 [Rhodiola kirilowii]
MALLGDDGRGYELAKKLESCGVWRLWLGDALYPHFDPFLSSPAAWEAFMKSDDSKSRAQIQLQLRARALLFDKASVSLFLRSPPNLAVASLTSPSSVAVSKLSPAYLQLHGDDVYFTLESAAQDGGLQKDGFGSSSMSSKAQIRPAFNVAPRYSEPEYENRSQRSRLEEFPESWYSQFFAKYKASRSYSVSGDQESDKRTPEEMSSYIRLAQNHKKRRSPFVDDQLTGAVNFIENKPYMHSVDEDPPLFPEIMFTLNSVPDTALPMLTRPADSQKFEFKGVFDTLPHVVTRSTFMNERLGIRPDYINTEQGGFHGRSGFEGKRTSLSEEQALQISKRVVVSMLRNTGFESATQLPVDVISQLLSCHINKLGSNLKVLADNYRKQCSALELIKMFLHSAKHSNLGALMELVKEGTRRVVQQTPSMQIMHPQFQQHHNLLRQAQQMPRAMHPQMQQLAAQSQSIAFQHQQQWDRMRRRQAPSPRPDQLVQVKLESSSDFPIDGNILNTMSNRHPRMQFRQQQLAAMSNFQAQQPNHQFRQMASLPLQATHQQVQSPNMGIARAPPVKVEGFQELMGGDASSKHDSDSNKLTSPQK